MTTMESLVMLLPAGPRRYAKAIVGAVVSAATIVAALADAPAWVTVVLAVCNAPAIYVTPNLDPGGEAQGESVMPAGEPTETTLYPAPEGESKRGGESL